MGERRRRERSDPFSLDKSHTHGKNKFCIFIQSVAVVFFFCFLKERVTYTQVGQQRRTINPLSFAAACLHLTLKRKKEITVMACQHSCLFYFFNFFIFLNDSRHGTLTPCGPYPIIPFCAHVNLRGLSLRQWVGQDQRLAVIYSRSYIHNNPLPHHHHQPHPISIRQNRR